MVSAILLAAGASKRMGSVNKLLMDIKGELMLYKTLQRLSQAAIKDIIVVLSPITSKQVEDDKLLKCKRVINPIASVGMTSSIQVGIQAASPSACGFLICMSDQPFITTTEYDHIVQAFYTYHLEDEASIIVPSYQEKKGNPVLFSSVYKQSILAHPPSSNGCKAIVQANSEHIHLVKMTTNHILLDIDTMDDYHSLT